MIDNFDFSIWTDTEKAARIEKLRQSTPIEISGNEIPYNEDLREFRRNAFEYGKNLRGEYVNKYNAHIIRISRKSILEALSHSITDDGHIQSIAAIPQIIESSIYIVSIANNDTAKHPDILYYNFYVCGLKIAEDDYTVKAVVAYTNKGFGYYDHKLTQIEKSKLLDIIDNQQLTFNEKLLSTLPVIRKSGEGSNEFQYKDKRLFSILQIKLPKSIGGVELSHEQQQALLVGEPIQLDGATDKYGNKHNLHIQWDNDANELKFKKIHAEKPTELPAQKPQQKQNPPPSKRGIKM